MSLVPARCTQCGSNIEIDSSKEAGICPHCGTAFITEKVVQNYNTTLTTNNNYSGATINYYGDPIMLEKHLSNARRAKQKEDWEEVEKYYNYAEQCDPTCIEAIFYSAFAKAKNSLLDSDVYKRENAFKILDNSISIIDDNFNIMNEEANRKMIIQIGNDIAGMVNSSYVYNRRKTDYGITTWTDKGNTQAVFINLCATFITSLLNIIKKYDEDDPKTKYLYLLIINHCAYILNVKVSLTVRKNNIEYFQTLYMDCHKKVNQFDPNHQIPEMKRESSISPSRKILIIISWILATICLISLIISFIRLS